MSKLVEGVILFIIGFLFGVMAQKDFMFFHGEGSGGVQTIAPLELSDAFPCEELEREISRLKCELKEERNFREQEREALESAQDKLVKRQLVLDETRASLQDCLRARKSRKR